MEFFSYMIPDEIKNMSQEEMKKEIARYKEEARKKREENMMNHGETSATETQSVSVV